MKVGVISDGVDARRTAQAIGDLPSNIDIDPNLPGSGDEGTALLEIVHDFAPSAQLAFSGPFTSLEMAEAILWLANDAFEGDGADIIVDDLAYYNEPYFEDGTVAKAAADAVAGGAVFVSSAGNNARRHYDGQFSDDGNGCHDFYDDPNVTDIALRVDVSRRVFLQWNDQFGSSRNDYDLFLCRPGLKPVKFNLQNGKCEGSNREQGGDDDPYETLYASFHSYSEADLYIRKYDADEDKILKLFVPRGAVLEHGVQERGVVGHEAVTGVLAVGAIDASDPGNDEAEPFSDRGPTEIYFPSRETRNKPDVMGIDGVSITGSGGFANPFFGTSAAAPHVAGIAALVMEAQRKATPDATKKEVAVAVTQKIRDTAVDLGDDGHDNTFGHGRADAFAAIESIAESSDTLDLYAQTSYMDTYTVNSTGDGADNDTSDGVCDDGTVSGSTNCTLRAAIGQANAGASAVIEFNITGGSKTISPASALPSVTVPVFIDGYSQPGASAGTVLIELDGSGAAGTRVDGLTISGSTANGSHFRGLAVNGFNWRGIVVQGSSRVVLIGNMIGTDTTGSTDERNGHWGVYLSVRDVLLRGNVISGNDSYGVLSSTGERIYLLGNKIGTNAAGTADLGNTLAGVHISSREVVMRDNVISGNDSHGVHLRANVTEKAVIENNRIGTNDAGTSTLGNGGSGIYFDGDPKNNLVAKNIIGGNTSHGIRLYNAYVRDNLVAENYIGTNPSGADLGNGGSGVHISETSLGGPDDNIIEANVIAYNSGDGVTITGNSSTGNTVWENSIHANDGHGIDLGDDGATANDAGDGDSGPNHLQNYPANITFASRDNVASMRVTLDVTANQVYIVDYYSCDSSGSGEGKEWLGFSPVIGSSTGNLVFSPSTFENSVGEFTAPASTATHVTATATDTETGSTSEFAPCVARVDLPQLVISKSAIEVQEDGTATYTVALSALPPADVAHLIPSRYQRGHGLGRDPHFHQHQWHNRPNGYRHAGFRRRRRYATWFR